MLDKKSEWGQEYNRGCSCPHCHNYNPKKLHDIEFDTNNRPTVRAANGNGMKAITPVLCGCCGTIFVRPYDLHWIDEH